nr:HTH domain-containing protein [Gemella palaticanis]
MNNKVTRKDIAQKLGLSVKTIQRIIKEIEGLNMLVEEVMATGS